MSDAHATGYYAAPGRETSIQAGTLSGWSIPADNISGPITNSFGGSTNAGIGTNAVDMVGLSEMAPSDVANSGCGPIPPGTGVIPTI